MQESETQRSIARQLLSSLRRHWILAGVWCAWVLVTVLAVAHHEPWRDEADPWLYARDAPWSTFIDGAAYAGTPSLWFLVQAPFARLGAPYEFLGVLHWVIALVGTTVFLWSARLPLVVRAAFAFSYWGAFEYAVVARSYALMLGCLWAALALWPSRRRAAWFGVALAVMSWCNIPGIIFAGALGAVWLASGPVRGRALGALVGLGTALAGWVTAVLQVLPPEDGQKQALQDDMMALVHLDAMPHALGSAWFPWGPDGARGIIAGALVGALLLALWRHRVATAFFLIAFFGLELLLTFVHTGYLRHWGFSVVAAIAAAWLAAAPDHDGPGALESAAAPPRGLGQVLPAWAVCLAVLAPWVIEGARFHSDEHTARFSNATAMMRYLKARQLLRREFAVSTSAVALVPWLPARRVWYASLQERRTYLPWNAKQKLAISLRPPTLARRARSTFAAGKRPLLVLTMPLVDPQRHGFRLIHAEAEEVFSTHGEGMWLYAPLEDPLRP